MILSSSSNSISFPKEEVSFNHYHGCCMTDDDDKIVQLYEHGKLIESIWFNKNTISEEYIYPLGGRSRYVCWRTVLEEEYRDDGSKLWAIQYGIKNIVRVNGDVLQESKIPRELLPKELFDEKMKENANVE